MTRMTMFLSNGNTLQFNDVEMQSTEDMGPAVAARFYYTSQTDGTRQEMFVSESEHIIAIAYGPDEDGK